VSFFFRRAALIINALNLDLGLICTHPKYQGQGLAAALLKPVLDIADAEGITAYVEALPNAKAVYEHYGFKTVDTHEYDLTKAGKGGTEVLTIMVREPLDLLLLMATD
jgi:GNAT superfamily N-acetyltransferase